MLNDKFIIVSVGEWHGRSGRCIADNLPENGICVAIDSWNGSSGEPDQHSTAKLREGDHAHSWWWGNLNEYIFSGKVIPMRMHSENAAETLKYAQDKGELPLFDMIFIDADHSFEGFTTDVAKWAPLMKDGAVWCGHDYYPEGEEPFAWIGVREGVQKFFPDAQKVATSVWWSKSKPKIQQTELEFQKTEAQFDYEANPEYAKVVENEHRELISKWFTDVPKDAAILDVGCGDGVALRILREQGFTNLTGLDVAVSDASTVGDMHDMPFPNGSFDILYSVHSLEHAHDPVKVLSEFHRVLKPEGQLFLALPYVDIIYDEHRAKGHCGTPALGLNVSDDAKTLLGILGNAGFEKVGIEGGSLRQEPEIYIQLKRERSHVYDCFLFNDEFDVLDIRFATLYDHVDRFVLVEADRTHSGNPKPLHFELNKERYAKYLDKISHIVVSDYPEVEGTIYDKAWARERWQRDGIMHGLTGCKDSDIIILGDADEIANPEAIKNYDVSQGLCRLKQRLFYYYLNCENKEGWDWLKIAPYKIVKELTPCGVRYPPAGHTPLIENGGWHFSFLGNTENAIKKVSDYAHREFDTPELMNPERVEKLISEGGDIFGRDLKYEFVEIDEGYPEYVRANYWELVNKKLIRFIQKVTPRNLEQVVVLEGVNKTLSEIVAERGGMRFPSLTPRLTVTASVSTKDRYTTTLPMCLSAILNQTHKPDKLVIYDDGEQKDLREMSPFKGLLAIADDLGIKWEIFATPRKGQVTNHQHCLDAATTDLIWRVDDDEVPAPDCLEKLLECMAEGVGAVGGLVHHPGNVSAPPDFLDGSLRDIQAGLNLAWYQFNGGSKPVQHLYSTFIFSTEAGRKVGGYPKTLSVVGHREESIFSHLLHRGGYKVLIQPAAKTYHLREATGGIRSFNDTSLWERDEQVWQSYLSEWGANNGKPTKLIVLDCGIGDEFAFKSILPEIRKRHADKELVLAVCHPQVFEGENLKLISIADAKQILGERYEDSNAYKHFWESGNTKPLAEAMLDFWG